MKKSNKNINTDERFKYNVDILAKGLFNIIFRSGPIEDYHATGCSINDSKMERLNRFGINRLGYMLSLILSKDSNKIKKFYDLCAIESIFVSQFDPIDFESKEVRELDEIYEIIKTKYNKPQL